MLRLVGLTLLLARVLAQREETVCFNNSEFLAVDESVNGFGAIAQCLQRGARPVVPFNADEHNAVIALAATLGGETNFWLGILLIFLWLLFL